MLSNDQEKPWPHGNILNATVVLVRRSSLFLGRLLIVSRQIRTAFNNARGYEFTNVGARSLCEKVWLWIPGMSNQLNYQFISLVIEFLGFLHCIQLKFRSRPQILRRLGLTLANSISLGRYLALFCYLSTIVIWFCEFNDTLLDGRPLVTYYSDVSLLMGWTGGNGFGNVLLFTRVRTLRCALKNSD